MKLDDINFFFSKHVFGQNMIFYIKVKAKDVFCFYLILSVFFVFLSLHFSMFVFLFFPNVSAPFSGSKKTILRKCHSNRTLIRQILTTCATFLKAPCCDKLLSFDVVLMAVNRLLFSLTKFLFLRSIYLQYKSTWT